MSTIVVVAPVLNRPHNAQRVVDSFIASKADARFLFVCSPGDTRQIKASQATSAEVLVVDFDCGRGDWARKINTAFTQTDEEFLLLAADDLRFHQGWDREALRVAEQHEAGVIGTNDLGNPTVMRGQHSTHSLVRRAYIEEQGTIDEPGKVLCERYWHNWCDNELVETAEARNRWAFARRSHVEHLHPHWGHGELDTTYRQGLRHFTEDRMLLQRRRVLWKPRGYRIARDRIPRQRGYR